MSSSSIWKKIRKKAQAIFGGEKEYARQDKKRVRKALSEKDRDLDKRIFHLRKSLKAGNISKKQYRLAKKLIIASYD